MQRKRDIALTIAIFSGAFIMGCTPNAGPQTAPTTNVQITKGPASSPGASDSPKAIGGSPAPALSPAPLASTRPDAGLPPSPQGSGQPNVGNPYASPPAGAILVNGGEVKSVSAKDRTITMTHNGIPELKIAPGTSTTFKVSPSADFNRVSVGAHHIDFFVSVTSGEPVIVGFGIAPAPTNGGGPPPQGSGQPPQGGAPPPPGGPASGQPAGPPPSGKPVTAAPAPPASGAPNAPAGGPAAAPPSPAAGK